MVAATALAFTGLPAAGAGKPGSGTALARITFYSGDRDSGGPIASTGVRLEEGKHVAVDPAIIPYGSEVTIPGLGSYRAVDCGSAVTARTAARKSAGGDPRKASAIVIDVFVAKRQAVQRMASTFPMYVGVSWRTPSKTSPNRRAAGSPSERSDTLAKATDLPRAKQTAQTRSERKIPIGLATRG